MSWGLTSVVGSFTDRWGFCRLKIVLEVRVISTVPRWCLTLAGLFWTQSTRLALDHLESVPEKLSLLENFKDLEVGPVPTKRRRRLLFKTCFCVDVILARGYFILSWILPAVILSAVIQQQRDNEWMIDNYIRIALFSILKGRYIDEGKTHLNHHQCVAPMMNRSRIERARLGIQPGHRWKPYSLR